MKRKFAAAAVAVAGALGCAPAFSQVYVSAAVGSSHADIDCADNASCKNTGFAGKAIVGYDFGNRISVEGMYVSLGKPTAMFEGVDVAIRSAYWGLGAAWRPEFDQNWSGVFRLGAAFSTSKVSGLGVGYDANGNIDLFQVVSQSYHSTTAYAGAGVAYEISKGLKLEADLDSTRISVLSGSGRQDPSTIDYTLGLTYQF